MKLCRTTIITGEGHPTILASFEGIRREITDAIAKVVHPIGAKDFAINPVKKGNGVKPIKKEFITSLKGNGWHSEVTSHGKKAKKKKGESQVGDFDAFRPAQDDAGAFVVEWETGNISSSHRAVNKMCLGILDGKIFGGALVLPSRGMYNFLTDRIGSYQELMPYFPIWGSLLRAKPSLLVFFEVEHDRLDGDAPLIPKGKDGNAKKATRAKGRA